MQQLRHTPIVPLLAMTAGLLLGSTTLVAGADDSQAVSKIVDDLIVKTLRANNTEPAGQTSDEDFLRRVTFDLTGMSPSPRDVTLFGLNPDPAKRALLIEQLLASTGYADNWSRYWRDVVLMRATNMRAVLVTRSFENWLKERLTENTGWDDIATQLITATGEVTENPETALIFAHEGDPQEIAAEVSRIFLGIQLQCANCHDHPTDQWKRQQFHQLAAFFPRASVRRVSADNPRSYQVVSVDIERNSSRRPQAPQLMRQFDRNRDGKLTKAEVGESRFSRFFAQLVQRGDTNGDQALSLSELKTSLESPPMMPTGRGSTEYFMPDLSNPSSPGTRIDPVFFVTESEGPTEMKDLERRKTLAQALTSVDNPWFAKSFVNRIWGELLGEGFYMPVDDIGPERTPRFPEVLDTLSQAFVDHNYDMQWLLRTITNTEAYQRQIRPVDASGQTLPFAAAAPTRLRSDQLYTALLEVLGIPEDARGGRPQRPGAGGPYGMRGSARDGFAQIFGFDPSTPQEDIMGNVPQALFMMNSTTINSMVRANGNTRLARILQDFRKDDDAINELYLLVLAREPADREMEICRKHIRATGNRIEAFEDLMWSLLNSSEFLSKR